ncbi:hypothetical protein [Ideonella sp.]|uniref:hypothetical protein n=1 Tax=Ideonella sp. TaxID=1929293 RepID=UPI003BB69FFE
MVFWSSLLASAAFAWSASSCCISFCVEMAHQVKGKLRRPSPCGLPRSMTGMRKTPTALAMADVGKRCPWTLSAKL